MQAGPQAGTEGSPEDVAALFANILDSATEYSMVATDPRGAIRLWNEGARRMYGYEPHEIIGRSWSALYTTQDREAGLPQRMAAQAGRDGKWEGTLQRVRKDGTEFTAHAVVTPRQVVDGRPAGFLLISSDISEEVRLNDANVLLESAGRAKDRFLARMSHELRTPLNAILGFTGAILTEIPGPLNAVQKKQLTTVHTNGEHLLSLINDLLDLARIESGKIELTIEEVDCGELLEDVARGLRGLADEKGLELNVVAPSVRLAIRTDRRALRQILINLANNAIKFTAEGSVCLELSRAANGAGSETRFRVIDTGCGVEPGDQEQLFAAFEQGGASASRPFEGTGLGLYICGALTALLGGTIRFESEFGRGSVVTLVVEG